MCDADDLFVGTVREAKAVGRPNAIYKDKGSDGYDNPFNSIPGVGYLNLLLFGTKDYYLDLCFENNKVSFIKYILHNKCL